MVVFKHERELYVCDTILICNTENPYYGFYLDERVRFIVTPREAFEEGDDSGIMEVTNLEIVFILVDKPPKNKVLAEIGIPDGFIERKFRLWVDQQQRKWSGAIVRDRNFFPYCDRYSTKKDKVAVKVVASLEEVSPIVSDWPQAEQVTA